MVKRGSAGGQKGQPSGGPAPSGAGGGNRKAELAAIRAQVEQARKVLADAVAKLGQSFDELDKESDAQKEMMGTLLATLSGHNAAGDRTDHLSVQAFARETGSILQQFTEMFAGISKQSIKTVYRIDDMAGELDAIFKLLENINEISEETFVLAVNANIQAANASDASGRSFAVIANNVRDLSRKARRFSEEIGAQVTKARGTVSDVRTIIADMASRDLNAAMAGKDRVQEMLDRVTSFELYLASTIDRANGSASRIGQAAARAVTALQFEDIVTQILGSVQTGLSRLEALRAEEAGGAGGTCAAPAVRNVVQQVTMDPDSAELF